MADHRLSLRSSQIEAVARAIAAAVGVAIEPPPESSLAGVPEGWLAAVVADLQTHQGASIVMPGDYQPPVVHALAHAINDALNNVNQTVGYTDPLEANPVDQAESLQELVEAMAAGQVELLVILEANPVYSAPADLNFAEHLLKVNFRVRQGLYEDETSALCHWHVPSKHYLESWGDARSFEGTVTLIQPLIEPLYEDRSAYQLLAAMLGNPGLTDYEVLQEYWQAQNVADDEFEQFWMQSLHNGFLAETALSTRPVTLNVGPLAGPSETTAEGLEIVFRPDPMLWDGRFANNGWLQELPKPFTKLTWDNVALVSPATAEQFDLMTEDVVELNYNGRTVQAPVWVMPGQADDTVTVWLGHGRVRVGRVGNGVGFNAYLLRTSAAPWFGAGLEMRKTGQQYQLATTQSHYVMEGRDLVRVGTIQQYQAEPEFVQHMGGHVDTSLSLLPEYEYDSYAWGMVIDLNLCNGCNACVVACQAENNIPIVGKDQVLISREMHWLRIDTYFDGELDDPAVYHQPMLCQHCEKAPCELVCPVNATVHDAEGLNVMVYNRCIGTRYCSNNCPYKVRRFNFLHYNDTETESLKALRNPEVSVRTRGVMEKCTYCIQRISAARINAKKENRRIQEGEVVTACQAVCPSRAIYFGDINDPNSEVSRLKAQPQNYGVLTELGTQPRTSYLAKFRNPNPALVDATAAGEAEAHQ
jgi:molybdopterin-containing oxidoreductase family iron-sulfur binding subunit